MVEAGEARYVPAQREKPLLVLGILEMASRAEGILDAGDRNLPRDDPPDQVGGMGLQLIQTLGCNASYVYENGWNIIRLDVSATKTSAHAALLIARKDRKKGR